MHIKVRTFMSAHLAVLDVIGQRVDHRTGTPFGSEQVQIVQSLQSCLEDTGESCDPQYED